MVRPWSRPSPNHALQRTAAGVWPFSVYRVLLRQPLSLSLSSLGPECLVIPDQSALSPDSSPLSFRTSPPSQSSVPPSFRTGPLLFRDRSTIVPDQSTAVPERSAAVPDQSTVVPERSVALPDRSVASPAASPVIPPPGVHVGSSGRAALIGADLTTLHRSNAGWRWALLCLSCLFSPACVAQLESVRPSSLHGHDLRRHACSSFPVADGHARFRVSSQHTPGYRSGRCVSTSILAAGRFLRYAFPAAAPVIPPPGSTPVLRTPLGSSVGAGLTTFAPANGGWRWRAFSVLHVFASPASVAELEIVRRPGTPYAKSSRSHPRGRRIVHAQRLCRGWSSQYVNLMRAVRQFLCLTMIPSVAAVCPMFARYYAAISCSGIEEGNPSIHIWSCWLLQKRAVSLAAHHRQPHSWKFDYNDHLTDCELYRR